MNWAKQHGLRYVDLEGMDPDFAWVLAQQQPRPTQLQHTPHWFKLAFGGEVILLPDNHEIVLMPGLAWMYRNLWVRVIRTRMTHEFIRKAFLRTSSLLHTCIRD
jgi:hypothetical protein